MDLTKTNTAVIKIMFTQMDKQTFILNAQNLKQTLLNLEVTPQNQNQREALKNVYKWLVNYYKSNKL